MESITDSIGQKFDTGHYDRIVSTVPSITETLFSYHLEKRIIGVTRYCVYPEIAKSPPREVIGGTKSLNIEKIIDLKPDLVIANKEENEKDRIQKLIDQGIPVFVTFPKTVEDAVEMMIDLYYLLQIQDKSIYNTIIQPIKEIINQFKSKKSKMNNLRFFCPIWKDPWMTINKDTFINSMIELAGGINIFRDKSNRYPKISIDDIIEAKPELVILPDEPYNFTENDIEDLDQKLPFKSTRFELIDGSYISWYSPRMKKGLIKLSQIIEEDHTFSN